MNFNPFKDLIFTEAFIKNLIGFAVVFIFIDAYKNRENSFLKSIIMEFLSVALCGAIFYALKDQQDASKEIWAIGVIFILFVAIKRGEKVVEIIKLGKDIFKTIKNKDAICEIAKAEEDKV